MPLGWKVVAFWRRKAFQCPLELQEYSRQPWSEEFRAAQRLSWPAGRAGDGEAGTPVTDVGHRPQDLSVIDCPGSDSPVSGQAGSVEATHRPSGGTLMQNCSGTQELRTILDTTTVGDLPLQGYPLLQPTLPVIDAVHEMRRARHGSALVCDEGRLAGIFTERDFLCVVSRGTTDKTLAEVMTPHPTTVTTDDSLLTATRLMDQGGHRRLPVVDAQQRPVGILDVKAVSNFIVEHFPEAIYNQAAHAQLIARHREGA